VERHVVGVGRSELTLPALQPGEWIHFNASHACIIRHVSALHMYLCLWLSLFLFLYIHLQPVLAVILPVLFVLMIHQADVR
jgi:hypothetical protein